MKILKIRMHGHIDVGIVRQCGYLQDTDFSNKNENKTIISCNSPTSVHNSKISRNKALERYLDDFAWHYSQ